MSTAVYGAKRRNYGAHHEPGDTITYRRPSDGILMTGTVLSVGRKMTTVTCGYGRTKLASKFIIRVNGHPRVSRRAWETMA